MGTNTFHLVIVDIDNDKFNFLIREKRAVRLGKGGINNGFITEEAMERALKTLDEFHAILLKNQVSHVHATATSAVRNAKNGKDLADQIFARTGIKVEIISGLAEAEFIYYGVSQALEIGKEPALIMDIGGGSIEFIIGNSESILWKQSFEIGGQRMMELFHENDPITSAEIKNIHDYLADQLDELFIHLNQHAPKTLIGSSGTFDTLSDIYCELGNVERTSGITEYPLEMKGYHELAALLLKKTRNERMQLPGMIELRVDMIVVAVVLISYVIKKASIEHLRVSAYALKEGVLLSHLKGKGELSPTNAK